MFYVETIPTALSKQQRGQLDHYQLNRVNVIPLPTLWSPSFIAFHCELCPCFISFCRFSLRITNDTPESILDQHHLTLHLPRGVVRTIQWHCQNCSRLCHVDFYQLTQRRAYKLTVRSLFWAHNLLKLF